MISTTILYVYTTGNKVNTGRICLRVSSQVRDRSKQRPLLNTVLILNNTIQCLVNGTTIIRLSIYSVHASVTDVCNNGLMITNKKCPNKNIV